MEILEIMLGESFLFIIEGPEYLRQSDAKPLRRPTPTKVGSRHVTGLGDRDNIHHMVQTL